MQKLCAVCHTTAEAHLCDNCQQHWDASSAWVQKLIGLEEQRRCVEELEETLTTTYITTDGCLWSAATQTCCDPYALHHDDDALLIQEIHNCSKTSGLTPTEQYAFEMMRAGLTLKDALKTLCEIETNSSTTRSQKLWLNNLIQKIRRAAQAGRADV